MFSPTLGFCDDDVVVVGVDSFFVFFEEVGVFFADTFDGFGVVVKDAFEVVDILCWVCFPPTLKDCFFGKMKRRERKRGRIKQIKRKKLSWS